MYHLYYMYIWFTCHSYICTQSRCTRASLALQYRPQQPVLRCEDRTVVYGGTSPLKKKLRAQILVRVVYTFNLVLDSVLELSWYDYSIILAWYQKRLSTVPLPVPEAG